jgi:NAD(P)-dependent dehydrogenase (short-subunit alcohol dehydrogenase family)
VAEARANAIIEKGGKAIALVADVMNVEQLQVCKQQVLAAFGKIDGLVNAAGGIMPEGVLQPSDDIFSMNVEGMKKTMDLNLWGTIIPTQVFGEAIASTSGKGSIVNISSMNSKRAITKVLGYNMGKAAVDCYNQWYAVELPTDMAINLE